MKNQRLLRCAITMFDMPLTICKNITCIYIYISNKFTFQHISEKLRVIKIFINISTHPIAAHLFVGNISCRLQVPLKSTGAVPPSQLRLRSRLRRSRSFPGVVVGGGVG